MKYFVRQKPLSYPLRYLQPLSIATSCYTPTIPILPIQHPMEKMSLIIYYKILHRVLIATIAQSKTQQLGESCCTYPRSSERDHVSRPPSGSRLTTINGSFRSSSSWRAILRISIRLSGSISMNGWAPR